MKTSTAVAILMFLLSSVSIRAQAAQDEVAGEWVGGYEIDHNYTPLKAQFEFEKGNLKGTMGVLNGETAGTAIVRPTFQTPNVRWEWPAENPFIFDGQLSDDAVTGAIQQGEAQGTFHLVRTVTLDAKIFDQLVGDYQIGPDRYVTVERTSFPLPGITFAEHDSTNPGIRFGQLYPASETSFFVGSGRWIPYPVEIHATFVKDEQGLVTALQWKPKQGEKVLAPKVKLHLYQEEEVKFSNGNVTLAGTLTLPSTKGPHPAVILIAGSDPNTRFKDFGLPQFFAQHGIAALWYDKRGAGDSTGDLTTATFEDLAADASAGVQFLQNRPDIDHSKVGLWGVSQGGWIAPLVATRTPNVAFMVLHAAPAVTPKQQAVMELISISHAYTPAELQEAIAFLKLYQDAMLSDSAYEKLQTAYKQAQARSAKWVWDPGPKDKLQESWFRLIMHYDPVPVLEKVQVPVLAFFGEKDGLVPPEGNVAKMEAALRTAGNPDVTIRVLPGVNHRLEVPGIGIYGIGSSGRVPPGYFDVMIEWIKQRVDLD